MSKKRTHEEALEETHAPNKLSKPLLVSSIVAVPKIGAN